MQSNTPSTLVVPHSAAELTPAAADGFSPMWLFGVGAILVVVAVLALSRRRARRMDPRELAFRTIVAKLGYTRQQIKLFRQTAMKSGMTSPVGVVMSPTMCDRILRQSKT